MCSVKLTANHHLPVYARNAHKINAQYGLRHEFIIRANDFFIHSLVMDTEEHACPVKKVMVRDLAKAHPAFLRNRQKILCMLFWKGISKIQVIKILRMKEKG